MVIKDSTLNFDHNYASISHLCHDLSHYLMTIIDFQLNLQM